LRNVRILAGAALATVFVALWGSAASAHVTVQPNTAEQGARMKFAVRVPNESDTASTIKVEVQTPTESPVTAAGLRTQPKEGWDVAIEKTNLNPPIKGETRDITEYVSKITWTAKEGYKIGPDQFEEFFFTTGPLPKDKTELTFKAIQTYDGPLADGSTEARWVEERQPGQEDPRRPEALVKLTPASAEEGTGAQPAAEPAASASGGTDTAAIDDAKSAASTARTIGILGLILAAAATVVAIGAFAKRPGPGASSSGSSGSSPTSGNSTAKEKAGAGAGSGD
jgi:uncharacterized protein YcnI